MNAFVIDMFCCKVTLSVANFNIVNVAAVCYLPNIIFVFYMYKNKSNKVISI